MAFFITKILGSALVIALVTDVAKLSDKWVGPIAWLANWRYKKHTSHQKGIDYN